MATKKLTRSTNKILAGVCGGIAEYFDVDPTIIRISYAALSFYSAAFAGLILYIIMMLVMPEKDKNDGFEEAEVVK